MFGMRHLQVLLMFLCLVVAYGMRVNMSVAIVAMTQPSNSTQFPVFDFSRSQHDSILSSFFWGYVILQIPAGELAAKFGGRILLAIAITVNSIVCLLTPFVAVKGGWMAVCACRVIQGLSQGFLYPTLHNLIGKWVPPSERGRLGTYVYAGAQLGTVIWLILSGVLGGSSLGWPSIFYSMGGVGLIWSLLWVWLGANSPATSKHITCEERDYIQTSLGQVGEIKKIDTPWRKIFTSLPFYALIIAHCGQNWGFWTLLTEMPDYINKVFQVDIKANGLYSALPYLGMYVLSFVLSNLSDMATNRRWVRITVARKLFNTFGFWGPAIALIALSYVPGHNVAAAVGMLTLTVSLNAGYYVGFQVVHIDMAPNFAGTLMGITNCLSNIVSIVAPLSVGLLVHDDTEASEWRKVFFVAAGVYFLTNLFFILFGSCETQEWNDPKPQADVTLNNIESARSSKTKRDEATTVNC